MQSGACLYKLQRSKNERQMPKNKRMKKVRSERVEEIFNYSLGKRTNSFSFNPTIKQSKKDYGT